MTRKILKVLLAVLGGILAAELLFLGFVFFTEKPKAAAVPADTTIAETAEVPTTTAAPTETTIPETTQVPTESTTPTETEPTETRFLLTFVGDCTLGSEPNLFASQHSFIGTIGTNYDYPFANVVEYFENDDFTMINLEGVFADSGTAQNKQFVFRGPTAYTQILTGSSVEAVTLANNHSYDFGKTGYDSTRTVLEEAGVTYVEENKTALYTTESGLTIGLYADAFQFSTGDIQANIRKLKDAGAEVIICAFHWGTEGSYRATAAQQSFAKAAIDAGAHIVYGHHPHVLQKIESYNGGIIYYSLGNFSFGGNHFPKDLDSAVVQQEIIRDLDGSIRLGETIRIPVSCSSMKVQNNFQPTPYPEGSAEYDRTLSKLDGSFTGPDLVVNYNKNEETTAPATTAPAGTEAPQETTPPTQPPVTEAPAQTQPPAETQAPTQSASTQAPPAEE